jgi:NAD(P)-dependent dehydrogenase (short-subunit alcohol dehydrogenase family)
MSLSDGSDPSPGGEAIVVGATGSLGGGIAQRLMELGVPVIGVARNRERLRELAQRYPLFTPCPADIEQDAAIGAITDAVRGPVRIAVMGAGLPVGGSAESALPADFGRAINVKIGGLVRLLRAVGDRLVSGSRIVILTGYHATEPRATEAMPGVVNAALHNFIRQLGDIWGPRGVTVHGIAPGPVDSPRLRRLAERAASERGVDMKSQLETYRAESSLGRLIRIEEVVWAVSLLLSQEASALHGSILSLDGGRLRSVR